METFKINREYRYWMDYCAEESERRKASGLPDDYIQEHVASDMEKAERALAPDSGEWEAVTVLYSFTHGVTGESMHFIRHDTAYVGAFDKKLHGMINHEVITDAELQEIKRCIV